VNDFFELKNILGRSNFTHEYIAITMTAPQSQPFGASATRTGLSVIGSLECDCHSCMWLLMDIHRRISGKSIFADPSLES
jgi:hypothetical protein